MKNCKWDEEEISFLKENHGILSAEEMSTLLDRYIKDIYYKTFTLGITRSTVPVSVGEVFGRLTVISISDKRGKNKNVRLFLCKCECGEEREVQGAHLRDGTTHSCGCWQKENIKVVHRKPPGISSWKTLYRGYVNGSKKRNFIFELSFEEFIEIASQNCFYCGSKPRRYNHGISSSGEINKRCRKYTQDGIDRSWIECNGIDRVDSLTGYILSNCVPCCYICNRAKSDMSHQEFMNWLDQILEFKRNRMNENHSSDS